MLYAVLLPFGTGLVNITFGILIFFWVVELVSSRIRLKWNDVFLIFVFSGYFILSTISLVYSDNIEYGLNKLLLQSYLLVFPLIIVTKKEIINRRLYIKLVEVFTLSLTLLCVISILNQLFKYARIANASVGLFFEDNLATSVVDYYFLGLSLAISFSLVVNFYLFNFLKKEFSSWYSKVFYFCIVILLVTLLLLNSRTILFLTVGAFLIIAFKKAVKENTFKQFFLVFLALGTIMFSNWKFNYIFNTKVEEAIEYNSKNEWGGRGMRFSIWDCAVNVIEENKLLGVGIGDQQDELTLCYKIYMKDQLLLKGRIFNTHNIFLQITLSIGVLGLLLFLLSFIYPIIKSFNKNPFYLCFVGVFIISGLTESYLERNVSIALFSFFNIVSFFAIQDENIADS